MSKNRLYGQYEWGVASTSYWQSPTDKQLSKAELEKTGVYSETVRHWFNIDDEAKEEIDDYIDGVRV